MVRAFILLGSNEGNRSDYLEKARLGLNATCGKVVSMSGVYETAAWGNTAQAAFLNQVISIDTKLDPHHLLHSILDIESSLGRIRTKKWASRTVDIDILFYGDHIMNTGELTIPHPAIAERRFTLVPMAEIAPALVHPVLKKSMKRLLQDCSDTLEVLSWG